MQLDLTELDKAIDSLEESVNLYRSHENDERLALALRDSVIQRFEYTFELCWKYMQKWIGKNQNPNLSEPVYSRKELFRTAAQLGLIDDPNLWFGYHDARNISSHTYSEENAVLAFSHAATFFQDARKLYNFLAMHND